MYWRFVVKVRFQLCLLLFIMSLNLCPYSSASSHVCHVSVCECDRVATNCFAQSTYNPENKNLNPKVHCLSWAKSNQEAAPTSETKYVYTTVESQNVSHMCAMFAGMEFILLTKLTTWLNYWMALLSICLLVLHFYLKHMLPFLQPFKLLIYLHVTEC